MKLLFKNTTTYSQQIYDDFLNFHTKEFSFKYHLSSLVTSMVIVFLIMIYAQNRYYGLAIILCACLTAFIWWRYFYPTKRIKKEYHSDKIAKQQAFTFYFYNKYFKVYTQKKYSIIHFRDLYKIFETDTFFYLYLDNDHSFLLDKSGFQKGTSVEFSNFVKNTYPFKYKLDKEKMNPKNKNQK